MIQTLLANVPRNGKFLYSAFSRFDGRDTMAFFASIGVPLKTERGNRVFPSVTGPLTSAPLWSLAAEGAEGLSGPGPGDGAGDHLRRPSQVSGESGGHTLPGR